MPNSKLYLLILFIGCCALFFNHPNTPGMFMDGALYSKIAQNIAQKGGWLTPQFDYWLGKDFFEHPPFFFMFHALLMKVFGVSWATARLANFIMATSVIFSLYAAIRSLKGQKQALLSCLVMLFTIPFLKKVRFPSMDIALSLFYIWSLFFYFKAKTQDMKYWIHSGLFLGLALLMKGHPGLLIIGIVLFDLILTKNIVALKKKWPWSALFLGMIIFSIWPLSLVLAGKSAGFIQWFDNQFLKTVIESRGLKVPFYFYFEILLKYCLPWFILTLMASYRIIKNKAFNTFEGLAFIWFWTVLLSMSAVGWKLSHYILPLYAPMAILVSFEVLALWDKYFNKILLTGLSLLFLSSVVVTFTPSMGKIRRHKHIFELQSILKEKKLNPNKWVILNGADGYWDFSTNASFGNQNEIYPLGLEATVKFLQNSPTGYLVYGRQSDLLKLESAIDHQFIWIKNLSSGMMAITRQLPPTKQ